MAIGRISTYNLHQALTRDTTKSQVDLFELQKQLSSGMKTDNFSGLGSDAEKFADLEARAHQRLERGVARPARTHVEPELAGPALYGAALESGRKIR